MTLSPASGRSGIADTSIAGGADIDVVCPVPSDLSLVHVDRCLFSIASQADRTLHVTIVVDSDLAAAVKRIADTFDWRGFSRPPKLVEYTPRPSCEASRKNFALAQAERRFVSLVDMRGTVYQRAYLLLSHRARGERLSIVYGDAVEKDMQDHETFLYEVKRRYRVASATGLLELRSGSLPPLGACLFDRDRIARADLVFDPKDGGGDAHFLARLLSRYPAGRIEERIPVFAEHRNTSTASDAAEQLPAGIAERTITDKLLYGLRTLRRWPPRRLSRRSKSSTA